MKRKATSISSTIIQPNKSNNSNKSNNNKKARNKKNTKISAKLSVDPSQRYIHDPPSCPIVKSAKAYFSSLNVKYAVHVGPLKHWRTVCKLPARTPSTSPGGGAAHNNNVMPDIGLFVPGTHQVVSVPDCAAHHPSINMAIQRVREGCAVCAVSAYNEKDGTGLLRFVAVNVQRSTGHVQITLVWNSKVSSIIHKKSNKKKSVSTTSERERERERETKLSELKEFLIRQQSKTNGTSSNDDASSFFRIHSLWVHYHAAWKHDNAIFGREENSWRLLHGDQYLEETLDLKLLSSNDIQSKQQLKRKRKPSGDGIDNLTGNQSQRSSHHQVRLQFSPNVFRQANIDSFQNIISSILQFLQVRLKSKASINIDKWKCVELYGGVGTIGLHVAHLFHEFVSSDENPHNVECFNRCLSYLPDKVQQNVNYIPKNATDMVASNCLDRTDIVIVDPPRKGLDAEVTDGLNSSQHVSLIIYVSCGFAAFKRDCGKFLKTKKWRLKRAEGHILFPGADHVETLAIFERNI